MSKTQPNYTADELEVIAAGVEETSEVSANVLATGGGHTKRRQNDGSDIL